MKDYKHEKGKKNPTKPNNKKTPKAENYYVRREGEKLQQAAKMQRGIFRRYRQQLMSDLA